MHKILRLTWATGQMFCYDYDGYNSPRAYVFLQNHMHKRYQETTRCYYIS